MSLKHTILGFLSFKPLSGYELKKAFDQSVSHFWPADQSQIYRTLKQLHRDELITQQVISREDRLDLKVYDITETGKKILTKWLSTPLPQTDNREPFLIQIYFAFMLEDDQVLALIEAELEQLDHQMEAYEQIYEAAHQMEQPDEHKRPFFYSMLTLEYGVKANVVHRAWLLNLKQRIESGRMTILPFSELIGRDSTSEETN